MPKKVRSSYGWRYGSRATFLAARCGPSTRARSLASSISAAIAAKPMPANARLATRTRKQAIVRKGIGGPVYFYQNNRMIRRRVNVIARGRALASYERRLTRLRPARQELKLLIAESRVLHRSLKDNLPIAARGVGVRLFDTEGRDYLDACGGAAVSCLGHSHPAPIAAIKRQGGTLAYAHTAFFTSRPAEDLAANLLARAPKNFSKGRVLFLNSGSEANEAALKLARQYHLECGDKQRGKFIARD